MDVPTATFSPGVQLPTVLPMPITFFGDSTSSESCRNANWSVTLSPSSIRHCKPSWRRVPRPAASLPGRRRRRTVMKRAGACYSVRSYRRDLTSRPFDKHYTDEENEVSQTKRRHLELESGLDSETSWVQGSTPSAEQAADDYRRAKIHVIQHIALHPDSAFDFTGRDVHIGGLVPVGREKRRVDWTRAPGATLAFYRDVLALVVEAWEEYGMDIVKTDLVQHMIRLQGTQANARDCLAAIGAREEAVEKQPESTAMAPSTPAKKPSRRRARLSDYVVASNVTAKTNSSTSPSHEDEESKSAATPLAATASAQAETEDRNVTPAKRSMPPPPSSSHGPLATATPRRSGGLGLIGSVPELTASPPPTPPSWRKWESANVPDAEAFQFSGASFEDTQASDHYSMFGSKGDRRKSEPLLQHLLRDRTRRFSASPQKFFAGADRFGEAGSTATSRAGTPSLPSTPTRPEMAGSRRSTDTDFFTPLPAYFRSNLARGGTPAADRNGVYSIDMRETQDIFGSKTARPVAAASAETIPESEDWPAVSAKPETKVDRLTDLAAKTEEDGSDDVAVSHLNGEVVVHFKLPDELARILGAGAVATTPVAKTSTRIEFDRTPNIGGLELSIKARRATLAPSNPTGTADVLGSSPSKLSSIEDRTLVVPDFAAQEDEPTERPLRKEIQEAPSSGLISDMSFNPSFQTPTFGSLDFSPSKLDSNNTPSRAPPSAQRQADVETTPEPAVEAPSNDAQEEVVLDRSPKSFTPVNKPTSPPQQNGVPAKVDEDKPGNEAAQQPSSKPPAPYDDDSPGRDFMYDFIRRSKPKRPTMADAAAAEAGSLLPPVPGSVARTPLGIKSPNASSPSPHKEKRKLDQHESSSSPLKPSKKPRRQVTKSCLKKTEVAPVPAEKKAAPRSKSVREKKTAVEETETAAAAAVKPSSSDNTGKHDVQEDGEGAPRRSTRLRAQPTEPTKSCIPTAIKLGRPTSSAGRGGVNGATALNSAVRSEQADLTRQTSYNTRRNKGRAESVQQVLARYSDESQPQSQPQSESEEPRAPSKTGKNVSWMDPVSAHQKTPKKSRCAKASASTPAKKASATVAGKRTPTPTPTAKKTIPAPASKINGAAKDQKPQGVTRSSAAPQQKSSHTVSQAAKNLGMAGNGTPAKRMTRAQTRRVA
ncbi:hypothetical protein GMORB2_7623 [Geosmithia morbida]|uniref:Uncharacterized protein n=1 Tax=Geosmithia morbida TaxID=1094350 RepID=A0A9P5D3Q7_9HYPO|nr:uncharacterized protein GMORB2_7623 [Geosmithia morbida]KAF4122030.1 hypothetical protein GMORB2_7623 [Geosmithia morbida]